MKVTVPEGKTLEKDIVMNEGVELQEVQVRELFKDRRKQSIHKRIIWVSLMLYLPTR